ncbi:YybH family protein [Ideonella oryzae]|uniref:Nuclear transport factor 2 family protein n=1 Tax=Ideonella oryzae TaxID=2937441 RepID=A0ABT1BS87_9BURK|nr:nuclear transport factor 2 family protein [Ideonella oryzae]MCO5979043.1 nuclear transport factor 2 family protein [Ideonella oryzae]
MPSSRAKAQTAALMASPDDVEAQFYEGLREGDLDKVMAVWSEEDELLCVHPGGPRLVGAAAVRTGFEAICSNGALNIHAENVRRMQTLGCAVHSVMERIEVSEDDAIRTGWVMATNVYLKTALGWRMVAHHASPASEDALPEIVEVPAVLH